MSEVAGWEAWPRRASRAQNRAWSFRAGKFEAAGSREGPFRAGGAASGRGRRREAAASRGGPVSCRPGRASSGCSRLPPLLSLAAWCSDPAS